VDPDIAGKSVGEINIQLFSWHWPGDDESMVQIVTSFIDTTTLSIVNSAISGPPGPSWTIRELWRCREEPNGDGGPQACNVAPTFDNNTASS